MVNIELLTCIEVDIICGGCNKVTHKRKVLEYIQINYDIFMCPKCGIVASHRLGVIHNLRRDVYQFLTQEYKGTAKFLNKLDEHIIIKKPIYANVNRFLGHLKLMDIQHIQFKTTNELLKLNDSELKQVFQDVEQW